MNRLRREVIVAAAAAAIALGATGWLNHSWLQDLRDQKDAALRQAAQSEARARSSHLEAMAERAKPRSWATGEATFRFRSEHAWKGHRAAGLFVDIVATCKTPDGERRAYLVATDVEVLDAPDVPGISPFDCVLTLRLSPQQAIEIEEAQRDYPLRCVVRRFARNREDNR